jgi:hypothetical protein
MIDFIFDAKQAQIVRDDYLAGPLPQQHADSSDGGCAVVWREADCKRVGHLATMFMEGLIMQALGGPLIKKRGRDGWKIWEVLFGLSAKLACGTRINAVCVSCCGRSRPICPGAPWARSFANSACRCSTP